VFYWFTPRKVQLLEVMQSAGTEILRTVQALVFDFDGTLVQTRIDFVRMRFAIHQHLDRWNLDEEVLGRDGYILELVAGGCAALGNTSGKGEAFVREAMQIIEAIEMETCPHAAPFPGVQKTLKQLSRMGYGIAIITRNGRRGVDAVTSRYDLCYDVLLTRDDVEQVKPHPEHLEKALTLLGKAPDQAAMIGDHPTDMLCGKAAGAMAIGILNDGGSREPLLSAGADIIIPAVSDLLQHLQRFPVDS
jgi:phosphoglycolate phosphatase